MNTYFTSDNFVILL